MQCGNKPRHVAASVPHQHQLSCHYCEPTTQAVQETMSFQMCWSQSLEEEHGQGPALVWSLNGEVVWSGSGCATLPSTLSADEVTHNSPTWSQDLPHTWLRWGASADSLGKYTNTNTNTNSNTQLIHNWSHPHLPNMVPNPALHLVGLGEPQLTLWANVFACWPSCYQRWQCLKKLSAINC